MIIKRNILPLFSFYSNKTNISISRRWATRATKKIVETSSSPRFVELSRINPNPNSPNSQGAFDTRFLNSSDSSNSSDYNSHSSFGSKSKSRREEFAIARDRNPLRQQTNSSFSSVSPSSNSLPPVSSHLPPLSSNLVSPNSPNSAISPVSPSLIPSVSAKKTELNYAPNTLSSSSSSSLNSPYVAPEEEKIKEIDSYLSMAGGFFKRGGGLLMGSGIGSESGFKKDDDKFGNGKRPLSTSQILDPKNGGKTIILADGSFSEINIGKANILAKRHPKDYIIGHPCVILKDNKGDISITPNSHSEKIINIDDTTKTDTGYLVHQNNNIPKDLKGKNIPQYSHRTRTLSSIEEKGADFSIFKNPDPQVEASMIKRAVENKNLNRPL